MKNLDIFSLQPIIFGSGKLGQTGRIPHLSLFPKGLLCTTILKLPFVTILWMLIERECWREWLMIVGPIWRKYRISKWHHGLRFVYRYVYENECLSDIEIILAYWVVDRRIFVEDNWNLIENTTHICCSVKLILCLNV